MSRPRRLRCDWRQPASDRFPASADGFVAAMARHDHALDVEAPMYNDPTTQLAVMTAAHLASRPCCAMGCRHCPWDREQSVHPA